MDTAGSGGSLRTSVRELADRWGCGRTRVRTFVQRVQEAGPGTVDVSRAGVVFRAPGPAPAGRATPKLNAVNQIRPKSTADRATPRASGGRSEHAGFGGIQGGDRATLLHLTTTNKRELVHVKERERLVDRGERVSGQDLLFDDAEPREPEEAKADRVFAAWRSCSNLIRHRTLTDEWRSRIHARIRDGYSVGELVQAVRNLDRVIGSDEYFWSYDRWTIGQFMVPGNIDRFLSDLDAFRRQRTRSEQEAEDEVAREKFERRRNKRRWQS